MTEPAVQPPTPPCAPLLLCAIAKNERSAVLEWAAWHLMQGFDQLLVADNGSSDGTAEFFEAMSQLQLATVLHRGDEAQFQTRAYAAMLAQPVAKDALLCFVDLDEFLVGQPDQPRAGDVLRTAFAPADVGAVALNWRCFGSAGQRQALELPVTQRFVQACDDHKRGFNRHIKTVVRQSAVEVMHIHHATLGTAWRYVDADGQAVRFSSSLTQPAATEGSSPFTLQPTGSLRVHHYVLKSAQEFQDKVARRQPKGANPLPLDAQKYFSIHDTNDLPCTHAQAQGAALLQAMQGLQQRLSTETDWDKPIRGVVDAITPTHTFGWVADLSPRAQCLRVKVYVNGQLRAITEAQRHRPDLQAAGICAHGKAGFRHDFDPPLNPGDTVQVRVFANPTELANATQRVKHPAQARWRKVLRRLTT
ncbi:glycosyltransferase family 2 protein [Roseateles sp. BYS180W]|uniref:Glycosyltransferase family 2 protein n=1 Tax=Roseateles rivi TaxID=3299028 RepID=A0ABW7FZL3_9BURK